MADRPQTQRDRSEAQKAVRQEQMEADIAQGRLVVRQMTPEERVENDARSVAASERRAATQVAKGRTTARKGGYPR